MNLSTRNVRTRNVRTRALSLDELEDAHEHAEILLTTYAGLLSDQLSTALSAWHGDLAVIIEDRYSQILADDAEPADDAV
jgi:hypothetical protein